MMTVKDFTLAVVAAAGLAATLGAQSASLDYTQWRGPNRDGSAAAFAEPKAWPDTLTRQWKVDVGLGYATPLVVGNRIYQFSRQGENETMTAVDAASGKVLWQTGYKATFTMQSAAAKLGYLAPLEAAGVTLLEGVCFYILQNLSPMRVANGWSNLVSNSAKIVNIIGAHKFNTILRRTQDCVEIAISGRLK